MTAATQPTVFERMAKVIAALDYIPKERSQGVNYAFRSIDALMNVLHGPLAEHGLFLSPRILDDWRVQQIPGTNNREQTQAVFRICVDVYAADGSSVTLGPGLAQSHDYGDKAVYQAQQNAIKYLLLEAFCIPTADQDMDAREADAVPARRAESPQEPRTPPAGTRQPPAPDPGRVALVKSLYDRLPAAEQAEVDEKAGGAGWWAAMSDAQLDKAAKRLEERHDALREAVTA